METPPHNEAAGGAGAAVPTGFGATGRTGHVRLLFIGDIVGKGGRGAVRHLVPELRREYGCAFVVANAENIAGGGGITRKCIDSLADAQVDVFTSGDHVWDQRGFAEEIVTLPHLLRPANFCPEQPGRGHAVFTAADGTRVGVLCLVGRTFMNGLGNCPFQAATSAVAELRRETPVIVVDFHAEATSEKIALGRFLDGRVSAVLGTHTHVETADQTVFPGGTAYHTDVGMVGAVESVLGRAIGPVIQRFATGMPARFTVVEKGIALHATLVDIEPATGRASHIERIVRRLDAGDEDGEPDHEMP